MTAFLLGHAAHPDWRLALQLAAAQVDGQRRPGSPSPTLGLVYFSDHYAADAPALLQALRAHWPGVAWAGAAAAGVAATGAEYIDEPALALLLADLPREQFRIFSGPRPLPADSTWTALVHADPAMPDLGELIGELADRTGSGYLFGGLASSRGGRALQFADGLFDGGLSGVGFDRSVGLVSRVTQGSQPVGPVRRVTAAEHNVVLALDGQPALPLLLADLGVRLDRPTQAVPRLRSTLVGLTDARDDVLERAGQFGRDTRVRHLIGLDPARQAFAVAEPVRPGDQLAFCRRDAEAARRDLVRICAEIREELEAPVLELPLPGGSAAAAAAADRSPIAGAVYVSCAGRGGPHFGGPSAELQIVKRALGEVPLVGFFAGGEIGRRHLYGYTGVLTVFRQAS
ncbi:FIST N-terminal domain-containing protein [Aquabacterium sp. J223]|uniref:FIST signal transduction protein n=1 Tax=Aquabacterium sp. J223 TaxID=2898431 RepID=UPI0021AE1DAB|nr:FIST N-terminal domain-containing protein [Aquabacterium sp. J223]UUX96292.1 FIST C-terminal domain-containing protein [Aquabacterium sp. J223]